MAQMIKWARVRLRTATRAIGRSARSIGRALSDVAGNAASAMVLVLLIMT